MHKDKIIEIRCFDIKKSPQYDILSNKISQYFQNVEILHSPRSIVLINSGAVHSDFSTYSIHSIKPEICQTRHQLLTFNLNDIKSHLDATLPHNIDYSLQNALCLVYSSPNSGTGFSFE